MAVRFLPAPEDRPTSTPRDRPNLAEVIDLRARLVPAAELAEPARAEAAPESPGQIDSAPDEALRHSAVHDAAEEQPPIMTAAVKILARKAMSSGELLRALTDRGYPEFDAEDAVAECVESLYIDDTDLARTVTQKLRTTNGASRAVIRQKLRDRRLPDECIELAISELDDDDELELLRQTASERARRMSGLDRTTAERRLLGYLARRGWAGERATRAVRDALDEHPGVTQQRSGRSVRFQ